MKKNDIAGIWGMDQSELRKKSADLKTQLAALSVNRYTKPSKNTREMRVIRKNVAIMKSIIKSKELTT